MAEPTGTWPQVPHAYNRDLVFGRGLRRFRVPVDRHLDMTPKRTWSAVAPGAALLRRPRRAEPLSRLAAPVLEGLDGTRGVPSPAPERPGPGKTARDTCRSATPTSAAGAAIGSCPCPGAAPTSYAGTA
ncbi:hypothetical protein GCM10010211_40410 [Streptomyces albospinus]|uniref:Uncharacterized protein n=1 Tax=Streptomyces albospinus TaxID=285515 RepID=A0ABQ2V7S0_9ACTN|nr:hypothetical protein GCM10010211_40410 [Streptomyces albospinus]